MVRQVSGRHAALLRGINVGKAKRVSMADLKRVLEELGHREVKTLLNSGNVVFTAPRAIDAAKEALRLEAAIVDELGVSSRVTVLTAAELARMVEENPHGALASDPARLLVTVLRDPKDRAKVEPFLGKDWAPGALGLGTRTAYLWCPDGLMESPLAQAVHRALGDGCTSRNWATLTKLEALARG